MKTTDSRFHARPLLAPARWFAFVAGLVAVGLAPRATALPLHTYGFNDVTTSSGRSSAGGTAGQVVFSNFAATATLSANSNTAGVFAFGLWAPGGATNQSNAFTGAIDLTEYFEFSVAPTAGFAVSLHAIEFSAGRTGTGPRQFVVRSDADLFATNLAATASGPLSVVGGDTFQFPDNAATNLLAGQSVALSGLGFTQLATARTFRLYAFNAEGAGQFRLDDVSIHGTVNALPDSLNVAAGLAGLMALAHLRRRGRRLGAGCRGSVSAG